MASATAAILRAVKIERKILFILAYVRGRRSGSTPELGLLLVSSVLLQSIMSDVVSIFLPLPLLLLGMKPVMPGLLLQLEFTWMIFRLLPYSGVPQ